jgi:HSP20 family molecular chaperone IbpA
MTESTILDKVEKRQANKHQVTTVADKRHAPYTDIFEHDDALVVVMEIPGVERENLDIIVEKNALFVEGRINLTDDNLKPLYSEFNIGRFSRSFSLTNEIDQNGITAGVADGVLSLTLPKAKEAATRHIEVQ